MRLALYQPDIPQNAGSLMRLGACLGVGIDLIEPCGFLLTDRNFRRAGMDYLKSADFAATPPGPGSGRASPPMGPRVDKDWCC